MAFANDKDAYLENLEREEKEIHDRLQPLIDNDILQVYIRGGVVIEDIYEQFDNYRDRIVIFHFGGHAESTHLVLKNEIANANGLAELFSKQKNLKLVFLNGCSTKAQVEYILKLGIPSVIATSVKINDQKATDFAIQFYQSLSSGASLKESYDTAVARLKTEAESTDIQFEYRFLGAISSLNSINENPWGFYSDNKEIENWKLPKKKKRPFWQSFLFISTVILFLILFSLIIWYINQPFNLTINLKNLTPHKFLDFKKGKITLTYCTNNLVNEIEKNGEIIFKNIPPNCKKNLRLKFESDGFFTKDTIINYSNSIVIIPIQRDSSLSKVYGYVMDSDTHQPLEGVKIQIQGLSIYSKEDGRFYIKLPFEKQKYEQDISAYKEGYEVYLKKNEAINENDETKVFMKPKR